MTSVFLIVMMLLLLIARPAAAQDSTSSRLTDLYDTLVPSLIKQYQIPGAALALIHHNEIVWSQGYGVADKDTNAPVDADTLFSVESISKALTSWEIMRLVEAGKIDLDAPVNQYLKSWQLTGANGNDPKAATIRRILSHTAGLNVDGYAGFDVNTGALPSVVDLLSGKVSDVPAVQVTFQPGTRFEYSGGGFTILQLMISDITGEPFQDVMQTDVLDQLGMTRSTFQWSPDLTNASTSYKLSGLVDHGLLHVDLAAGGLFTSANDLARFFTVGLSDQYLKPDDIALMHTPAAATDGQYGFGNFLFTLDDGTPVVWHDGIGAGQRSIFFWLPQTQDGLIILTNKANGNRIFQKVVCAWDSWLRGEQTKLCQSY